MGNRAKCRSDLYLLLIFRSTFVLHSWSTLGCLSKCVCRWLYSLQRVSFYSKRCTYSAAACKELIWRVLFAYGLTSFTHKYVSPNTTGSRTGINKVMVCYRCLERVDFKLESMHFWHLCSAPIVSDLALPPFPMSTPNANPSSPKNNGYSQRNNSDATIPNSCVLSLIQWQCTNSHVCSSTRSSFSVHSFLHCEQ